ncbi:MAG: DUF1461 domain-containing protein [Chloroflexota bacterium]|nr:DUF1461 domain-containing protein [Chloroflexota bacterium]
MRLPRPLATGFFAVALAIAGTLVVANGYAGESTYRDLARSAGFAPARFHVAGSPAYDLKRMAALHRQTLAFVEGSSDGLPTATDGAQIFDDAERAHLLDVRGIVSGARVAFGAALAWLVLIVARSASTGGPREVALVARDGAIASAIGVAAIVALAAVAFEPVFLLFHEVFFPQGNFAFDPATSDLLALYPEPYWSGLTLRIGLTFLGLAAGVAGAAALFARRAR